MPFLRRRSLTHVDFRQLIVEWGSVLCVSDPGSAFGWMPLVGFAQWWDKVRFERPCSQLNSTPLGAESVFLCCTRISLCAWPLMRQVCQWKRSLLYLEEDWCAVTAGGAPVLHGFVRSEDVTAVLRASPPGTFLFRFSSNHPGQLAVGVNRLNGSGVVHSLITALCPGVAFQSVSHSEYKYGTLQELVRANPELRSYCETFPSAG